MIRNVLIYGLVLGAVLSVNMFYMVTLCYTNENFESNDILGYAVMVLMFSLISIGVRNYRNKFNNGIITFGKAFKTGILIAFLGSTLYVVVWLFYYYLFVPDFLDKYIPHVLKEAAKDGATTSELAEKTQEMAEFKEMYRSPLAVILITYSEVFPVGFVVALISALVLKRKPKTEEQAG